jgi:hypothetical protein
MTTIITVIYETDKGIFRFTVEDMIDHLNRSETEYDAKEVTVLKDLLSSATADSITMPKDLRSFPYFALDLIRDRKETVYCRTCGKSYESGKLKPLAVGHGETPFSVKVKKKGGRRKLFGKRRRLLLFGAKGYQCPEGHATNLSQSS